MLDELGWGVLPWLHRPHNFVRALAHVAVGGQDIGWTCRVAKYPEAAASVEQQTAFLRQHVDSVRLHERVAGVFLKETPLAQVWDPTRVSLPADPSNLDPNYLSVQEMATSPWHAFLHEWRGEPAHASAARGRPRQA